MSMSEYNRIRIALCDDVPKELSLTVSMVNAYMDSHPEISSKLEKYHSPVELLEAVSSGKCYEIYLLDILMPEINGINLGKAIRQIDEEAVIIYLTTSSDYAVQSYSVHAFYYLLKPIVPDRLHQILEDAIARQRKEWDTALIVKTSDGLVRTPLASLMYVEYQNHRLAYHMANGTVIYGPYRSMSFGSAAADILEDSRFLKVSTSFLVNLSYVHILTAKSFILKGNFKTEIPISRAFYKEVKNRYLHYFMERRDL